MRFLIFLSLFLLVYGGMHLYLYRRLRQGARWLRRYRGVVIPLLLLLMFMPITIRILESHGYYDLARPLALLGFLWMGWLLLFCFYALAADLLTLIGRPLSLTLSPAMRLPLVVGLALTSAGYGFFEARQMRVDEVRVISEKVMTTTPYRVVQLSDVHVGLMTRPEWLEQVIERVNGLDPDLVLITGDLVDGNVDGTEGFIRQMQGLYARDGVFGVTGNHEYIAGIDKSLDFFERSGVAVLRGETADINGWLTLIGVDDPGGHGGDRGRPVDEPPLLSSVNPDRYRLLLKHRPVVAEGAAGLFDLQLSGHVHQGQIFPFVALTWLAHRVHSGFNDVSAGSRLYVNRGTGTWGPPIRFLAPPEITLFEFTRG